MGWDGMRKEERDEGRKGSKDEEGRKGSKDEEGRTRIKLVLKNEMRREG